jgi:hypothetical protein
MSGQNATIIAALALPLVGCSANRSTRSTEAKTPTPTKPTAGAPVQALGGQPGWSTTALPVASEPVAVKEGGVPLVYLVESPGTFRVHDQTAGQDLARGPAAGRSIVRVDGRAGVVFGRETLFAGPLATDHRYVIYRDPTGPNMARQGTFQLLPRRGAGGTQSSPTQIGGHQHEGGPNVDR